MPRVLFLEDEPRLVRTLPAVLEDKDNTLQVVGLRDIAEALTRLREEEFDIVLLDISMPPTEDMDFDKVEHGRLTGIAVAQSIKNVKPDMPIIALTVVSKRAMQRKMQDAGIVAVINKPAEIDAIIQILHRHSLTTRK
jgi:CheY-like chemotaxis protein